VRRHNLIAGVVILCAGCLPIPHQHVKRPAAVFRVRDQAHVPIASARITLRSAIIVGRVPVDSTTVVTNDAGIARTTRQHEWHEFIVLVPDGEAPWVWSWSVDAPGYQSASGAFDREPADTVRVTLEARRSSAE
jgi:hypothetical protein